MASVLLLVAGAMRPVAAQRIDLWIDASAAHARPPADATGAGITTFGLLGTRLAVTEIGPGSLDLAFSGGRGAKTDGGAWIDAALGGNAGWSVDPVSLFTRVEAIGLSQWDPWRFAVVGLSLTPMVSAPIGEAVVTIGAELTRGRWWAGSDPRTAGRLGVAGGVLSVGRTVGPLWLETTAEAHDARNGIESGGYRALSTELAYARGRMGISVAGTWSHSPSGGELGYQGMVNLELSDRVAVHVAAGRHVTDPLYGSPGSATASIGLSWRAASRRAPRSLPVVEIAEPVDGRRRVRFRIEEVDAVHVALAGDFTDWKPRAMHRSGDAWTIELALEPGLHYFGFMLDGERWYVPETAPGIVDDGWGRRNASVVVEGT